MVNILSLDCIYEDAPLFSVLQTFMYAVLAVFKAENSANVLLPTRFKEKKQAIIQL